MPDFDLVKNETNFSTVVKMFGAKMMDFSFGYEHGIDTSYNMPMSNQEVRTRVRIYPYDPPLCPAIFEPLEFFAQNNLVGRD